LKEEGSGHSTQLAIGKLSGVQRSRFGGQWGTGRRGKKNTPRPNKERDEPRRGCRDGYVQVTGQAVGKGFWGGGSGSKKEHAGRKSE